MDYTIPSVFHEYYSMNSYAAVEYLPELYYTIILKFTIE
jgi:hypothetical protein